MRPSRSPNRPIRSSQETLERAAQLSYSLCCWCHIARSGCCGFSATECATDSTHRIDDHIGGLSVDELQPLIQLVETTSATLAPGWCLTGDALWNRQVDQALMGPLGDLVQARDFVEAQRKLGVIVDAVGLARQGVVPLVGKDLLCRAEDVVHAEGMQDVVRRVGAVAPLDCV